MKVTINFLILFFCININIIFTTCYRHRLSEVLVDVGKPPKKKWSDNYVFTGISQQCNWNVTSDFTSNLTRGNRIVINPKAHILHPDSFFGYNSGGPKFNYERVECEFNVAAPLDYGLVVSIQQMNFDKECSDFVQITNCDGSLNKTICDTFGGFIPRSYPGGEYLGELILNEYNNDSTKWQVFHAEDRIRVKISVTKKNFENLRYLFIAFTALEKDSSSDNNDGEELFSLSPKYYCDDIENWKKAGDEDDCGPTIHDHIIYYILLMMIVATFTYLPFLIINDIKEYRKRRAVPVQPSTTAANPVDTPSVNLDDDKDKDLPTYEELFPEKSQQIIKRRK